MRICEFEDNDITPFRKSPSSKTMTNHREINEVVIAVTKLTFH